MVFFQLFRLKKDRFETLRHIILHNDEKNIIKKKYRDGRYPVQPEKKFVVLLLHFKTGQITFHR